MNYVIPETITGKQLETLKSAITAMSEDISIIEKLIGSMLIKANNRKELPVISFCHDALQSLRLLPIYTRNVLAKLPSNDNGETTLGDDAQVLLNGLASTIDEALLIKKSNADMENLPATIDKFCLHEDYFTFGVEVEVTKIRILSIKLNQVGQEVLQAIEGN